MRLLLGPALALAALPVAPALADLGVGGQSFATSEILDARALPDAAGRPAILITFTNAGAKRYAKIAKAAVGRPLAFTVAGKPIATPVMGNADDEGAVQLSGDFASFDAAAAIAKQISGRDPVPEENANGE